MDSVHKTPRRCWRPPLDPNGSEHLGAVRQVDAAEAGRFRRNEREEGPVVDGAERRG